MKNKQNSYSLVLILTVMLLLQCGCASKPLNTVGFLSDYSKLEPESDKVLRYQNATTPLKDYSQFIVDPVVVRWHEGAKGKDIDPKKLAELRKYMYSKVQDSLLDHYDIVRDSGRGIARIRIAITDVKKATPFWKICPVTGLLGGGRGALDMEAELLDSVTGEQIRAVVQYKKGKVCKHFSKWGDAKAIMRDWARNLEEDLRFAHLPE